MHMLDLQLDPLRLVRFAATHGHNRDQDEDHGYSTHAWLKACFANLAPKTHRLMERRDGRLRLLAYSDSDREALYEHATAYADPVVTEVADWNSLASKEMPTRWKVGQRLGFEVRACPITRSDACERDIYLTSIIRAQATDQAVHSREEVYQKWFTRQLGPAATSTALHLIGFRRIRGLRRNHDSRGRASSYCTIERPDALFAGVLEVRDPLLFTALLERGLGRHRAFGFGMLLLRPPKPDSGTRP